MVDATNVMERKGAVYPFARAAGIGYGLGHKRNDDLPDGVCEQIADCTGWWDQLETVNEYDGGSISRRAGQIDSLERSRKTKLLLFLMGGKKGGSDNSSLVVKFEIFIPCGSMQYKLLNGQEGGSENFVPRG